MKIVKYIFFLIILLAMAAAVFIATQNGTYQVSESRVMPVPKDDIYNYVNDYSNWEKLEVLPGADTTAVYQYNDRQGTGSRMNWENNNHNGSIETLSATADSIVQRIIRDDAEQLLTWIFKDTITNATKVTVKLSGKRSFNQKALLLVSDTKKRNRVTRLSHALVNLENYLTKERNTFDILIEGLVMRNGGYYISHVVGSEKQEVYEKVFEDFGRLKAFSKDNNLIVTGVPFLMYTPSDSLPTTYIACLPIKDEIITPEGSDIYGGKLYPLNALKVVLKGDYKFIRQAYSKATAYIAKDSLSENRNAIYIEEFIKTATQTKLPSAKVTTLYIPIGPQQTEEKDTLSVAQPVVEPAVYKPRKPKPRPKVKSVFNDSMLRERPQ